jgi:hypothetical protein
MQGGGRIKQNVEKKKIYQNSNSEIKIIVERGVHLL